MFLRSRVFILITHFHHHHCLVIGSIFRPFHRPRCPAVPSSVRPCHLLPIFTARGWIFTDEWSQQRQISTFSGGGKNATNDVQSSTSSPSIVIVITSIFRPYHRPKCPSVPSSAHLHRQRHMLNIHRRMVTATVSVLSVVEQNKFKNMLKVQLAKQIKRSSSLRRIRLYMELWNTFAILAIFDFPI